MREVNENFPRKILEALEPRYHKASVEFEKMKKHQAKLKARRGHSCPWADKASEDAWVRKIRGQWHAADMEVATEKPGRPGWGFSVLLKIWVFAPFFGCEQNAEEIASRLAGNPRYARLCGLPKRESEDDEYETPSARTLRHFNQVMYVFELWNDLAWLHA
jgi:hypothetical protein